ncbi:MAG: hypothetical protein IPG18_14840 [Saprospiraceae bacterium]|nr:hypothetical protein [Saprospiraceae bacterium]
MEFKYKNDYNALSEKCPPKHFTEQEINPAFRWLFNEHDPRNFIPQFHRKPKRFINMDDKQKCTAMGLSFFKDLNGAVKRHNQLSDVIPNIGKAIGTLTSKGYILEKDGISGDFGELSHFTHHAYDTDVFKTRFEVIIQDE